MLTLEREADIWMLGWREKNGHFRLRAEMVLFPVEREIERKRGE